MDQQKKTPAGAKKQFYLHLAAKTYLEKFPKDNAGNRAPDNTNPIGKSFESKKYMGMVRYFAEDAGQGFICDNLTKQNYFVYTISLEETIKTNDQISFELTNTPGGTMVTHVKKTKNTSL